MDELSQRLLRCFTVVFPDVSADALRVAEVTSLPQWDSIATATLVSLVQEEFGIEIPIDELPNLTSFTAIRQLLV